MTSIPEALFLVLFLAVLSWVAAASTTAAVAAVLISAFSMGLVEAVGLPLALPKAVGEYLALALLLKAFFVQAFVRAESFKCHGIVPLLAVLAIATISTAINGTGPLSYVLFARMIVNYYILFLALANLGITDRQVKFWLLLIVALFLIQLPVSWLKLATYGIDEDWIGTIHMQAGTLSMLMPLTAIAVLMALMLYRPRASIVFLIVGFFVFAVIGQKRAILFVAPCVMGAVLVAYLKVEYLGSSAEARHRVRQRLIFVLPVMGVLALAGMYLGARIFPSLNPEDQVWGSFSPSHIVNFLLLYSFRGMESELNNPDLLDTGVQVGRLRLLYEVAVNLVSASPMKALFGFGAGVSFPSYLTGGGGFFFQTFGVRGTISGLVTVLADIGFVGAAAVFVYLGVLGRLVWRGYRAARTASDKALALGVLGIWVVLVFDFSVYSHTFMRTGVLAPVFFLLLAVVIERARVEEGLAISLPFPRWTRRDRTG